MALIYAEQRNDNETTLSDTPDEDIETGALVVNTVGGGVSLADADVADFVSGIALNFEAGDNIAAHEYDYKGSIEDFVYEPASSKDEGDFLPDEDDRVPIGARFDGARLYPKTTDETTEGVTSAPSISYNAVVGVVDTSDADAPAAAGRIVEEGYTNDENDDATSTTFSRDNDNFVPLGRARALPGREAFPVTDFGTRVWVERDRSL